MHQPCRAVYAVGLVSLPHPTMDSQGSEVASHLSSAFSPEPGSHSVGVRGISEWMETWVDGREDGWREK